MTEIEWALQWVGQSSDRVSENDLPKAKAIHILAKAYREQEARIKELEGLNATLDIKHSDAGAMIERIRLESDRRRRKIDELEERNTRIVRQLQDAVRCPACKAAEGVIHHEGCLVSKMQARIKELECEAMGNEYISSMVFERDARIAALELALKKYAENDCCEMAENDGREVRTWEDMKKFRCGQCPYCVGQQALSGSKLGELFQALLEEHKFIKGFLLDNPDDYNSEHHKKWLEVESLLKECGL